MDADQKQILNQYIQKIEIYKCSICELEGSEEEILEHLKTIENKGKFPFKENQRLPTGSLVKVKNNHEKSYSLTTIDGYFYTENHDICYYIHPKIATRDYDHYSRGEYGEYVHANEILNCRKIKELELKPKQNELLC